MVGQHLWKRDLKRNKFDINLEERENKDNELKEGQVSEHVEE